MTIKYSIPNGRFIMRNGNLTKHKVITEALLVFHEKGYHSTSMQDIVHRCGVAKGNLYFHFTSKEDLAMKSLREGLKLYGAYIAERTDKSSAKNEIISVIKAVVSYHSENGIHRGCLFGNMALELGNSHGAISSFLQKIFTRWQFYLSSLFMEAKTKGEIRSSLSAENFSLIVITQLEGAIMLSKLYNSIDLLSEAARLLISLLEEQ